MFLVSATQILTSKFITITINFTKIKMILLDIYIAFKIYVSSVGKWLINKLAGVNI